MRMLACNEILKERSFSWQTSLFGFLKSFAVIFASSSSSLLMDIGDDNPDDIFTVQGEEHAP